MGFNSKSHHLLSAYCVPATVLRALCRLAHAVPCEVGPSLPPTERTENWNTELRKHLPKVVESSCGSTEDSRPGPPDQSPYCQLMPALFSSVALLSWAGLALCPWHQASVPKPGQSALHVLRGCGGRGCACSGMAREGKELSPSPPTLRGHSSFL